jgi:type IV pilus assembly protein PilA
MEIILMKKQSGFTLIELLLVLAIIGIISAIAIPALLAQRTRAKDKTAQSNASSIISEVVAAIDKAGEDGTAVADASDFKTTIIGTSDKTKLPGIWTAKNPWGAQSSGGGTANNAGYDTSAVATETSVLGTVTKAAATTLGQVKFGYGNDTNTNSGVFAAAVKLKGVADPTAEGTDKNVFVKTTNVE